MVLSSPLHPEAFFTCASSATCAETAVEPSGANFGATMVPDDVEVAVEFETSSAVKLGLETPSAVKLETSRDVKLELDTLNAAVDPWGREHARS